MTMDKLKILVINNYGQTCHLIHRSLRDLGMDAALLSNTSTVEDVQLLAPDGLVFSGGPTMERAGNGAALIKMDLPILGICLGHHGPRVRRRDAHWKVWRLRPRGHRGAR